MHADTPQPHMHASVETHTCIRTYTHFSFFLVISTDCWTCSNRILCTRRQRKVWIQHSANCKFYVNFLYFITFVQEDILQIVSYVVQLEVESLSHRMWWTVKTPLGYLTCRLAISTGFALHSMRWGPACTHPVKQVCQYVCLVIKRLFCCNAVPSSCKRRM